MCSTNKISSRQASFWHCIQLATVAVWTQHRWRFIDVHHPQTLNRRKSWCIIIPTIYIILYAISIIHELLEDRGYQLIPEEGRPFGHIYCPILRQLRGDRHLYATLRHPDIEEIPSSVGRYFGLQDHVLGILPSKHARAAGTRCVYHWHGHPCRSCSIDTCCNDPMFVPSRPTRVRLFSRAEHNPTIIRSGS